MQLFAHRILGSLAACALVGGSALGAEITFNGAGDATSWSDPDNWDLDRIPADGDHAVIPNEFTVEVDITNARADSIDVQTGGLLKILAAKKLELDSNSIVADVKGLVLAGSGATLRISGSMDFTGAGSIQGRDNNAKIDIGSGFTLTNKVKIEGALQLGNGIALSQGTFVNGAGGKIVADQPVSGHGVLRVVSPLTLGNDDATAEWRVVHADARLEFDVGSTSLSGDFFVEAGEMQFDAAVTTTGDLTFSAGSLRVNQDMTLANPGTFKWDGGTIFVATDKVFEFYGYDANSTKANPDVDRQGDTDPPYEVDHIDSPYS